MDYSRVTSLPGVTFNLESAVIVIPVSVKVNSQSNAVLLLYVKITSKRGLIAATTFALASAWTWMILAPSF